MRKKRLILFALSLTLFILSGCGTDPEVTQFKKDIDAFCTAVSELDASINNVDTTADNASELVFKYLDQLDVKFQEFASMDFPKEYDYLEPYAIEAGQYMSTAVSNYHDAYQDGGYNEEIANYARENSARAFKRVQGILACLRGDPQSNEQ